MPSSFGALHPLSITVPAGYGYVALAATSALWVTVWQGGYLVGQARKRSGIKYPQMYAEKAEAAANKEAHRFNCTQRAHQVSRRRVKCDPWCGN